jgi:hypothetical protein
MSAQDEFFKKARTEPMELPHAPVVRERVPVLQSNVDVVIDYIYFVGIMLIAAWLWSNQGAVVGLLTICAYYLQSINRRVNTQREVI